MKKVIVFLALIISANMYHACNSGDDIKENTPTYSISGVVTTSDGGASAGAAIQLQNLADGSAIGQTTADATGTYVFSGIPTGEYQIIVMLDGYETATISGVEIKNGDVGGKDIVLQKITVATYTVSGVVTKSDGGAAVGATVKLLKTADGTLTGQATVANADGAFTLAAIPSGEYKIVVMLDGYEAATLAGITVAGADITGKNIVLQKQEVNPNAIYINFSGNTATINNPYAANGVSIVVEKADVSVTSVSDRQNIEYIIKGNTSNGSLTVQSATNIKMKLDGAQITSATLPAIQITSDITTEIILNGTNALTDGVNTKNATLISKGGFIFSGYGDLTISGKVKHAVSSSKDIRIESGNITIPEAASDGFHSEGFMINGGALNITATGDAVDAGSGTAVINGGNINIASSADDTKGIKSDDNLTINGGAIAMTVAGKQSKAISSKKDIAINNGNITIETSGAAVLEQSGSGYDPSYCTAIKADGNITVSGGTITVNCLKTANGGKGFSADGDITITGGAVDVTTAGDGAVYTNETGATDSYSSCCIKADKNISLLRGKITCSSSGSGGKAISADGTLTIGETGANDNALVITASTTGQKFLVTGSTGGGRPGGMNDNADYANPKIIKSAGNLTVNSGTLWLTGTTDGGEGLESKATLTVNGGYMEIRTYDDCLNAATHIQINGGTIYARATGNDAIDSNGDIAITGGMLIVQGSEDGVDSDNTPIQITGGTVVGVSGQSMGSRFAGTQKYVSVSSVTAGSGIGVKIGDNWTLLFQVPANSTSGGGFGGGRGLTIIISLPQFVSGASYTLYTGGSITGGSTTAFGYNVGGTYSGGTSKSYTVN